MQVNARVRGEPASDLGLFGVEPLSSTMCRSRCLDNEIDRGRRPRQHRRTSNPTGSSPIEIIETRQRAGSTEDFHVGGSDASGIVYAVGDEVTNVEVGDVVVIHHGWWESDDPWVTAGKDPMIAASARIWGYDGPNYGSFGQFTVAQAHQCMSKAEHLTWEEAAAPSLVGTTAYRMLFGWQGNTVREGDVVLIWGGSGGLGSAGDPTRQARGRYPGRRRIEHREGRVLRLARCRGLRRPYGVRPLGRSAPLG